MPLFEELPDDYDVHASRGAGVASGTAVRRGFLNRQKPTRQPVRVADILGPSSAREASPAKPQAPVSAGAADTPSVKQAGDPTSDCMPNDASDKAQGLATQVGNEMNAEDAGSFVKAARVRLQAGLDRVVAVRQSFEVKTLSSAREAEESLTGLEKLLTTLKAWPSSELRTAREETMHEVKAALAEMRAASNDARSLHSGEERVAATELRHVAQDAVERVRKVAEVAAQREVSKEDRAQAAMSAFHALPLMAKLRMLANDKAAYVLFGTSFLVGMALMLAVLGEVHSAWSCGMLCSR